MGAALPGARAEMLNPPPPPPSGSLKAVIIHAGLLHERRGSHLMVPRRDRDYEAVPAVFVEEDLLFVSHAFVSNSVN
jgi:hypothetical protein